MTPQTFITFQVPGLCKPAGSKRALPVFSGSGPNRRYLYSNVVDACEKSQDWKADVSIAARAAYKGPLLTCPLAVSFTFFVSRPGNDYGTGKNADKLKPGAPGWPTKRPDLLKLARGVEDAMTGVIYRDDNLIVQEVLEKKYANTRDGFIGVTVTITALEAMPVNGQQKELLPSGNLTLL